MSCPDCDPAQFKRDLEDRYGPPVTINGCDFYRDPEMPREYTLDPAQWARAICPIHGMAFLREPSPDAVEERRQCEVCAPEPCKGHKVITTTPGFNIKGVLR